MTKRILLGLLALTVSVLAAAVVPLGFKATGHEFQSYVDNAREVARAAASLAEEDLADHQPVPGGALSAARHRGDTLAVLNSDGRVIGSAGPLDPVHSGLVEAALGTNRTETRVEGGYVTVVLPVREGPVIAGTVILARPLAPLHARDRALWFMLALISAAAIGAATMLALAIARWVSRPLAELDASARRLGAGDLAARAPDGGGPPELRRLALSFNAMAARLEKLVHGNRTMVADVSHQLRTPLAALRLRLDLLAQDADPETAAELAGALEEFGRLSRLVDGLLAVARAENSVPRPVAVDVGAVIRERVAAWRPVADDRGVWLGADAAVSLTAALGDGDLEQILDNLIANALDATAAGDHITVSAAARSGPAVPLGAHDLAPLGAHDLASSDARGLAPSHAGARPAITGMRLVVADDGPGMSPQERAGAFGRFATANPNGNGLGLAIVHRLVTSNGGTPTLEETPGGGLSVIAQFPGGTDLGYTRQETPGLDHAAALSL